MTEISTQDNIKNHERTKQPSILKCIATILEEIVEETDKLDSQSTPFHASKIPAITLENYLIRIAKYAKCTDECFVIALIYLDKVQELHSNILLNSHCVHRFLMIALVLAIKFQDDDYYRNDYYSKIAGITLKELNQLESELLELLKYDLFISKDLYNNYLEKLKQYCKFKQKKSILFQIIQFIIHFIIINFQKLNCMNIFSIMQNYKKQLNIKYQIKIELNYIYLQYQEQ